MPQSKLVESLTYGWSGISGFSSRTGQVFNRTVSNNAVWQIDDLTQIMIRYVKVLMQSGEMIESFNLSTNYMRPTDDGKMAPIELNRNQMEVSEFVQRRNKNGGNIGYA